MKHLEVKRLWVQEKVRDGSAIPVKIPRAVNVADMLTHPCAGPDLSKHLARAGVEVRAAQTRAGTEEAGLLARGGVLAVRGSSTSRKW